MSRPWTDPIKDRLNRREFTPKASDREALSKLLDQQFPLSPSTGAAKASWTQGALLGGLSVVLMLLAPADKLETPQALPAADRSNAFLETKEQAVRTNPMSTGTPENHQDAVLKEPLQTAQAEPIAPKVGTEFRTAIEPTGRLAPVLTSASTAPKTEAIATPQGSEPANDPNIGTIAGNPPVPSLVNEEGAPLVLEHRSERPSVKPLTEKAEGTGSTGVNPTEMDAQSHYESAPQLGTVPEDNAANDSRLAPRGLSLPLPDQPQNLRQPNDLDLRRKPSAPWGPDAFGLSVGPGVSDGWEAQGLVHWNRSGYRWGTGFGLGQTGAEQKRLESYAYWDTESRQEWQTTTQYIPQIDSTWRILGINQGGWDIDTTYIAVVDSNWVTVVDSIERQGTAQKTHRRTGQLFEWPVYGERVWSQGRWAYSAGAGMGLGLLRLEAEPELGLPTQDIFRTSLELRVGLDWRWNEHGSVGLGWNPRQVWYADPEFGSATDLKAFRFRLAWRW
ncbi:hypothetical protein GC167_07800 [bacterium]|nr:hypothetical protein [bacterium]